jgi:hypothetical protein
MYIEDRQYTPKVGVRTIHVDGSKQEDLTKQLFVAPSNCVIMYIIIQCDETWVGPTLTIGNEANQSRFLVDGNLPKTTEESPVVAALNARMDKGSKIILYASGTVDMSTDPPTITRAETGTGVLDITVVWLNIEDANLDR